MIVFRQRFKIHFMGETATHWIILHNGLSVSSGPATYVRIQCSSSIRLRSVPLRQRLALSGVIPAVLLPVWFQNVTCPMGALCLERRTRTVVVLTVGPLTECTLRWRITTVVNVGARCISTDGLDIYR